MKNLIVIFVVFSLLYLAGCANANPYVSHSGAGFLTGFWHGLICPFSLVISLFNSNCGVYEVFNDGLPYNFGFVIGAVLIGKMIFVVTRGD